MIAKIITSLVLFIHSALFILMIFGMSFGVGLGEISQEWAQSESLKYLIGGALFALAAILIFVPRRSGSYLGFALLSGICVYLVWLMATGAGDLRLQIVLLSIEVASLALITGIYRRRWRSQPAARPLNTSL